MSKKIFIVLLVVLSTIVLFLALFLVSRSNTTTPRVVEAQRLEFYDEASGISLEFVEPFKQKELSKEDKQDNFLLRLESTDPPMLLTILKETGIRQVSTLARQEPLQMIMQNAIKSIQTSYNGFELKNEIAEYEIAGKKAGQLDYTYIGPSGERARRLLTVVLANEDTALYLSAQTTEALFTNAKAQYIQPILDSVTFR
jgi:hypothetical protein